jgi:D-alanyl-D-alanine carboxypeptidase/D-alanyl-D-alanine-endopeptidase (penicillin-binding protein 4)
LSADRTLIYSLKSPQLREIVKVTNVKSHNLFAEHLLKSIGLKLKNVGSDGAGSITLKEFWSSKGVNVDGMVLNDGCGLSRLDILTARQLSSVLATTYHQPWYKDLYESLNSYSPKIKLKSGYMTRARSYAGYVNGKTNKYAFAVIVNNYDCSAAVMKKKLEDILEVLNKLE